MSVLLRSVVVVVSISLTTASVQADELDSDGKKFIYLLVYQYVQSLQARGLDLERDVIDLAVEDVLADKPSRLSNDESRAVIKSGREAIAKAKQAKAEQALKAGKAFLEENSKKPGVVVLPSGVQYIEHRAGEGDSPKQKSTVRVNYRGTLIDGTEFDSSYKRGQPTSFPLDGVIKGFSESIQLMKPGAKWTVFIPAELGYGMGGVGSNIGPNEALIFEIELISFE